MGPGQDQTRLEAHVFRSNFPSPFSTPLSGYAAEHMAKKAETHSV